MNTTPNVPSPRLQAVLERLLPVILLVPKTPKKGSHGWRRKEAAKNLAELLTHNWPAEQVPHAVNVVFERLIAEGVVEKTSEVCVQLTDTGRQRALSFLGLDELRHRRVVWAGNGGAKIKQGYLTARALGILSELSKDEITELSKVDGLRRHLIQERYDLDPKKTKTIPLLRKALGWVLLAEGASESAIEKAKKQGTFSEGLITDTLMYSSIGRSDVRKEKGHVVLAAALVKAEDDTNAALYRAILRRLVDEIAEEAPESSAVTHQPSPPAPKPSFADLVRETARQTPTGRFDEQRIFINHVWRTLKNAGASWSLDAFKQRLLEAHRADEVTLGRAEMPQSLDPTDLAESRIDDRNQTLVFIKSSHQQGGAA